MTREEAIRIIKEGLCYLRCANGCNMDECKANCEYKEVVEVLEQEPCTDAISRQAVDDAIYDYSRSCDVNYGQIMEYIDKLPSVNPQEPKTGHWIDNKARKNLCNCSECGALSKAYTKYCHNCGAKMAESEEV